MATTERLPLAPQADTSNVPDEFCTVAEQICVNSVFTISLYGARTAIRSEEHTSELQSLMRISYAVFCLKKKNKNKEDCKLTISLHHLNNTLTPQCERYS